MYEQLGPSQYDSIAFKAFACLLLMLSLFVFSPLIYFWMILRYLNCRNCACVRMGLPCGHSSLPFTYKIITHGNKRSSFPLQLYWKNRKSNFPAGQSSSPYDCICLYCVHHMICNTRGEVWFPIFSTENLMFEHNIDGGWRRSYNISALHTAHFKWLRISYFFSISILFSRQFEFVQENKVITSILWRHDAVRTDAARISERK